MREDGVVLIVPLARSQTMIVDRVVVELDLSGNGLQSLPATVFQARGFISVCDARVPTKWGGLTDRCPLAGSFAAVSEASDAEVIKFSELRNSPWHGGPSRACSREPQNYPPALH